VVLGGEWRQRPTRKVAVAKAKQRATVFGLELDLDQRLSRRQVITTLPSPREGDAPIRHNLLIGSARDGSGPKCNPKDPTWMRIKLMLFADPARHQRGIDQERENSFRLSGNEDLALNDQISAHLRLALRSACSAARFSCANPSSQNDPSSALSLAIAGPLMR
jgi:hypothetical protein